MVQFDAKIQKPAIPQFAATVGLTQLARVLVGTASTAGSDASSGGMRVEHSASRRSLEHNDSGKSRVSDQRRARLFLPVDCCQEQPGEIGNNSGSCG